MATTRAIGVRNPATRPMPTATLCFSASQALLMAKAGAAYISPFVGRIMDWHKKAQGVEKFAPAEDPGVMSVTAIYNYFKRHGYGKRILADKGHPTPK